MELLYTLLSSRVLHLDWETLQHRARRVVRSSGKFSARTSFRLKIR